MATFFALLIAVIFASLTLSLWRGWRRATRAEFIRSTGLPPGLFEKLKQKHPTLDAKQFQLVARGLRHFFLAHLKSGCRFVAMPSQIVDDLWHEFILYTKHYDAFCNKAFGKFMHHTPAIVLTDNRDDNTGLRRIWWFACLEENINPRKATRLPLLFALDSKLGIANGFRYDLRCKRRDMNAVASGACSGGSHCATDFSDSSFDGGTDGLGDGGDGGGGDGGSGCGGGCGGGD
jgi:hypothetical protein